MSRSCSIATCRPHESLAEAVRLMDAQQVDELPVLDDQGRAIGRLTRDDAEQAELRYGVALASIPIWAAMSDETTP